jgi:general nucleoside transport system ATP-binding protein
MPDARDTAATPTPLVAHSFPASAQLEMRGIVKRYGAVTALNAVDLTAYAGEIHALLGENGAGKSTLMHVLSGLTPLDAGTISLAGAAVRLSSPRAARAHGIAMVHQHFTLVPAFTVEENLALDARETAGLRRGYTAASAAAPALKRAAALGWHLEPGARVGELSVGAQQRVEIVKALATNARLLIFDEPTAVLAGDEVHDLFQVLRRLRDEGCTVILIAHKLAEIVAVADRVTVLRRGRVVASSLVVDTNTVQLAQWMVGATPTNPSDTSDALVATEVLNTVTEPQPEANGVGTERTAPAAGTAPAEADRLRCEALHISVQGDRGEPAVRGVTLAVRAGEIFGIGGVDGNGQTELAEALVGLRPLTAGEIRWRGRRFAPGISPRTGYIPQDRRRAGLAITMSIEENLLWDAVRDPRYRNGFLLRRKALRQLAETLREQFDIRTPSVALPASALSGGNQQKIVVARALHAEPEWIVAVNPTRGLDIGATRFVHTQLRQARARGAAVVLISTDLDEIAALADRAAILSAGTLTEYDMTQADSTQIGLLLGGLTAVPEQTGTTS